MEIGFCFLNGGERSGRCSFPVVIIILFIISVCFPPTLGFLLFCIEDGKNNASSLLVPSSCFSALENRVLAERRVADQSNAVSMGKAEIQQYSSSSEIVVLENQNRWWTNLTGFFHGVFSFKCFLVLLISFCVLFSALFWLPPFHSINSGFDSSDPEELAAPVQASFRLQKPVSLLTTEIQRLEYDILEEIGLPNTKVSIIALHPLIDSNWTSVIFGLLPEPSSSSINQVALSVLRSSLMELVVKQWNLTLTPSIFGQPSIFEVLKFPGGITVIPPRQTPLLKTPQILFNFTLNNSISQIQENLNQLKDQLKFGLQLRSDENLYVQVTNLNGSTLAPPAIVQASLLSAIGSPSLLQPQRLRQLAQTISASHGKNLGLDHSIFGRVKQIQLSSYLKHSLDISPSQSPSPVEAPSPNQAEPPVSDSPAFSPYAPTPSHGTIFPPKSISPYVPSPESWVHSPSPLSSLESPAPAPISTGGSPSKSPCHGYVDTCNPLSPVYPDPPTPLDLIPSAAIPPQSRHLGPTTPLMPDISPSPAVFFGPSPPWDERNANTPAALLLDSVPTLAPSPSSSYSAGPRIILLFGAFMLQMLF